MLGLSAVSYLFGVLINKYPKRGWIHACGVILVLGVLILFKYLGFLGGIFNSLAGFISALPQFEIRKLLLPLGISYIVFKHISYLTDIKWGLVKPGRFIDFLFYSSFFTIFVAGPIERFERFKPQIEQSRLPFSWSNIDYGFMRIVFGMFKKMVLANWIGYFISPIWANPHHYDHWIRLLALLGYAFQIYFDFAGYSDIAIGSSRLFGIKIMENFNNPYLAPNMSQFWRRWHISLSDWIRDYLFFPLARLKSNKLWALGFVPVISMALCGLWHGSAGHFIVWGAWHGLGIALYQSWVLLKKSRKKYSKRLPKSKYEWFPNIITFMWVTMGWVFFVEGGLQLAQSLFNPYSITLFILLSSVIVYLARALHPLISIISKRPFSAVYFLILTIILYCSLNTTFIYNAF